MKLLLASTLACTVLANYCLPQDNRREQHEVRTVKANSCMFNGSGVVPNCILQAGNGNISIAPEVLKQLRFDSHGLAPVFSEDDVRHGWMYVNRKGNVVVSGVASFDNWADEFSDGLVRIVVSNKYGFADREGRIIIKPTYDWASPFQHGSTDVCNECREMCMMPGGAVEIQSVAGGCDHRIRVGGDWFKVDKKGRVVTKLPHH